MLRIFLKSIPQSFLWTKKKVIISKLNNRKLLNIKHVKDRLYYNIFIILYIFIYIYTDLFIFFNKRDWCILFCKILGKCFFRKRLESLLSWLKFFEYPWLSRRISRIHFSFILFLIFCFLFLFLISLILSSSSFWI